MDFNFIFLLMARYEHNHNPKLIYAFTIPDEKHNCYIKIGETSFADPSNMLDKPNSESLNKCAIARIDTYTKTAGIDYVLLYTESAMYWSGRKQQWMRITDKTIHKHLLENNIERANFGNEWFKCDVEYLIKTIKDIKQKLEKLEENQKNKKKQETKQPTLKQTVNVQEKQTNQNKQNSHYVMIDDFNFFYSNIISKTKQPADYGNFDDLYSFYEYVKKHKPKSQKYPMGVNCDVLRLEKQPLGPDTICYLPEALNRRVQNVANYALNEEDFKKFGDKYYYVGQCIRHTDDGRWIATTTEHEKDKHGAAITNVGCFDNLQDAIDYRNNHACETIRKMSDAFKDYITKNTYDVLSTFDITSIRKLQQIQQYRYDSRLHLAINKIKNSKNIDDKSFLSKVIKDFN